MDKIVFMVIQNGWKKFKEKREKKLGMYGPKKKNKFFYVEKFFEKILPKNVTENRPKKWVIWEFF